jgi:hypothetical protein
VSTAMNTEGAETAAEARLIEARDKDVPWKLWGPYLSRMPELRDAVHATGPGHFGVAERGMIGATISFTPGPSWLAGGRQCSVAREKGARPQHGVCDAPGGNTGKRRGRHWENAGEVLGSWVDPDQCSP